VRNYFKVTRAGELARFFFFDDDDGEDVLEAYDKACAYEGEIRRAAGEFGARHTLLSVWEPVRGLGLLHVVGLSAGRVAA
jgi:hypothetical protein